MMPLRTTKTSAYEPARGHRLRRGYTLLEIVLASGLLTVMATAAAVVLRGGQLAWLAHEDDLARVASAQAVTRHVVRQVRQAQAVVDISPPLSTSGTLSLLMPDGQTFVWEHQVGSQSVLFGSGTADQLLADQIVQFTLIGYERDATTPTTVVGDIRVVEVRATILRSTGLETFRARGWIRSW